MSNKLMVKLGCEFLERNLLSSKDSDRALAPGACSTVLG